MENMLVSLYIGAALLLCVIGICMAIYMIAVSIEDWIDVLKWVIGVPAFIFVSYWLGHFVIKWFELM